MDTSEFLEKLALSSLKHREVLETMSTQAPEDAKPVFNRIGDYCKKVYEQSSHALREMGKNPPPSPFYD
jgi:hypothetical protein